MKTKHNERSFNVEIKNTRNKRPKKNNQNTRENYSIKENEFQMVHKLFMHYLRRYEEFQHKYIFHRKLWLHSVNDFNELVKHIREFDNSGSVDDLKQRLKEVDSGGSNE